MVCGCGAPYIVLGVMQVTSSPEFFCPACRGTVAQSAEKCEACGALFGEAAWKPRTMQELVAAETVEGKTSLIGNVALLTFPLWGTVAGAALAGLFVGSFKPVANIVYFSWMIGLLVSPVPILRARTIGIFGKFLILMAFCAVAAVVVFIAGWVSACAFLKACH